MRLDGHVALQFSRALQDLHAAVSHARVLRKAERLRHIRVVDERDGMLSIDRAFPYLRPVIRIPDARRCIFKTRLRSQFQ